MTAPPAPGPEASLGAGKAAAVPTSRDSSQRKREAVEIAVTPCDIAAADGEAGERWLGCDERSGRAVRCVGGVPEQSGSLRLI